MCHLSCRRRLAKRRCAWCSGRFTAGAATLSWSTERALRKGNGSGSKFAGALKEIELVVNLGFGTPGKSGSGGGGSESPVVSTLDFPLLSLFSIRMNVYLGRLSETSPSRRLVYTEERIRPQGRISCSPASTSASGGDQNRSATRSFLLMTAYLHDSGKNSIWRRNQKRPPVASSSSSNVGQVTSI